MPLLKQLTLAATIFMANVCAHASTLNLPFNAYLVQDNKGAILSEKNSDIPMPVASLTKLMTAYVVLKDDTPLNTEIEITREDVDLLKNTRSRLLIGTKLTRKEALELALVSSENRAAHALGRTTFNSIDSFVAQMNKQAKLLGMTQTRFVDPTGLSPLNTASARDIAKLIAATEKLELVKRFSNIKQTSVSVKGRDTAYRNSNILIKNSQLEGVTVSKTGFTAEAGRCIALKAQGKEGEPITLVGLGAGNSADRTKGMRTVLKLKPAQLLEPASGANKKVAKKVASKKDKKKKTSKKQASSKKR